MISTLHAAVGLLAIALATGPTPAAANGPGGVKISGSINQTVVVGSGYSDARGSNATATTNVGSIAAGTQVNGDVNLTAIVGGTATVARGNAAQAVTEIGTISRRSRSGVSVTVVTGMVANIADGGQGCVLIGSDRTGC